MATLDAKALDALNELLEDTRASVEIELALVNGATELRERETLDAMGGEEVLYCCALRERLTISGATVTWRINGIVFHILGTERYDDRLRSFARHQAEICERTEALLATVDDAEAHNLLQDLYGSHVQSARWAEQRANEFAASRLLDLSTPRGARPPGARSSPTPRPPMDGTPPEPAGGNPMRQPANPPATPALVSAAEHGAQQGTLDDVEEDSAGRERSETDSSPEMDHNIQPATPELLEGVERLTPQDGMPSEE